MVLFSIGCFKEFGDKPTAFDRTWRGPRVAFLFQTTGAAKKPPKITLDRKVPFQRVH
jgi:hypothetical protein